MKKDGLFDVTMGAYDGAEVCEFVGTYLLDKISVKYDKNSIGGFQLPPFKAPTPWFSFPPFKILFPLPSFLFHPLLIYFRQFPPP